MEGYQILATICFCIAAWLIGFQAGINKTKRDMRRTILQAQRRLREMRGSH